MAKKKIENYVFLPGVAKSSNAYPDAYAAILANKEFIIEETKAYINARIVEDNASNIFPYAVTLLTNNKAFIIDEIIAWVAARVAAGGGTWSGYTYSVASCRRDTGLLIDAYIYDLRYGGNERTIEFCKNLWQGGVAQLISPTQEILGFDHIANLITNYILIKAPYASEQSPVTTTQNTSGTAAEAGSAARIVTLKTIVTNVIPNGLSVLPTLTFSEKNYAGYQYDSSKCNRDIGLIIDAYLHDLRYGGNYRTRYISSRFWNGTTPQLSGDRKPEITAQTFARNLINDYVLTQTLYTTEQSPTIELQDDTGTVGEAGANTRITELSTGFINVLTNGLPSLPALAYGVTTIRLLGKYDLNDLLLITNATTNTVIYNFSDSNLGALVDVSNGYVSNDFYYDEDFGAFRNKVDYVTTIYLDVDTSTGSISDEIQIFTEGPEMRVRPYDFGTDAIERHRVAQAQSMLDADFEYGLQPTKWQAIGLQRGYPSVYEVPGSDTAVVSVVTDASAGTGGVGESLITVTTSGPHGFTAGQPITIKSLANSISGFSRAEGTFLVNAITTTTTFTYYAQSKVGTINGQVLATTYTQLRKALFYTGANLGAPTFSVYSNGETTTFTTVFDTVTASDQIAFSGTVPSIGSPLTGTGMGSGAQITGVVGSGGIAKTSSVRYNVLSGENTIEINDPTGVLEGMAINRGDGTSIFVSGVSGDVIEFTGAVTSGLTGDTQTYPNITGTDVAPIGSAAEFEFSRIDGEYVFVGVSNSGQNYKKGDRILLAGTNFGGTSPANDITITVIETSSGGSIEDTDSTIPLSFIGTSVSGDVLYSAVPQDITSGFGASATFDITRTFNPLNGNGEYLVTLAAAGSLYIAGDTITIYGTSAGGVTPDNDITITIGSVDLFGAIVDFTPTGIATTTTDQVFTPVAGTNIPQTSSGAIFDITRSNGAYIATPVDGGNNYISGNQLAILGTSVGGTSPLNDILLTVYTVSAGVITAATTEGTSVTGSSLDFYSAVSFSEVTTAIIAAGTTITASPIAVITATFATAHGLVPGASVLVDIFSTGTNHGLAKGPFYVEVVPSLTTFRYTCRATGAVDTSTVALAGIIYTRPDSFFIHRPYDGGVMLGTGGPQHGAQAIRMSKKYIRYQSGKGVNYCTGALFAPSFNIQSATSTGTAIGSFITITMDDVDHGCQVGGTVKLIGVETFGYNGTYTVTDIVNERTFKVQAQTVLANTTAVISANALMSLVNWHGASVRAGTFDEQNGIFFQYDGQDFSVVKRSSTQQLAGVVNISKDSNLMTGTNTRFRDQLKAGDRIVIKGMTHVVTNVTSQTSMTVNPDYRGASNAVQAKLCVIQDQVIKQRDFNIDRLDGTGPSGFLLDVTKMQMIGMQWSWYAVGFIDWMLRGSDGNFIFFHRMRNSNVNTEAYMRTGNQAVRYEVLNESAKGKLLSSITASQTTIPLANADDFPNEAGVIYIDNEFIAYSGKTNNVLTGCTRAAPMTNFLGGAQRTFRAGSAATHEFNTGVILVSNTISPIISHWGSAMLTDGLFDEDRGYIFNYAATNVNVSTTKQTAFLIRLAPSVSNAIIGDLGDRELLNRAQLLLKQVEVTADGYTGSTPLIGGIVIEGVLNPQNYPTNPSDVQWTGLQGSAQGGQPSFAQIAPGGSVVWAGGGSTSTSPSTTLAFPTGTIVAKGLSWRSNRSLENGSPYIAVTEATWNTYISSGMAVGDRITAASGILANTTIAATAFWYTDGSLGRLYYIQLSQNANANVAADSNVTVSRAYPLANTSTIFFQQASWESVGAKSGTEVADSLFPSNTFVNTATIQTYFATTYYRVTFSQTSTSTPITAGTTTITFKFGLPPYAQPGETVFSFIASPGTNSSLDLSELKELTNTTLGGRGTYPNGPDVLAINVYKAAGAAIPTNIVIRWGEAQA